MFEFGRFSAVAVACVAVATGGDSARPLVDQELWFDEITTQWAQRLFNSLFPDLSGPQFTVQFDIESRVDGSWVSPNPILLAVRKTEADHGNAQPVLKGHMLFRGGDFESVSFEGEYVSTSVLAKIESAAKSAQSWTLEDVRRGLNDYGARFGPDDEAAFVSRLDIDRWSLAFGPIAVSEVRFVWHLPEASGEFTAPVWIVRLISTGALGAHRCYSVMIEPIQGRPIAVRGHDCPV